MRKSLIRWVLLAVIVLGIIIGGPIIINEFYRNNSGYITIWGAADVLTYYGAIIAASGAAIGVYCSIRYSHKQYREDKRRDVLPYFAINILGRKCVSPFDLGWYPKDFSAAVQAIGGTLGPVIPPSLMMIFYGVATGEPITKLLMSGVVPGILACILLCLMVYIIAKKRDMPVEDEPFSWKRLWDATKDSILALLMPIIILVTIYFGICTATESAAIAAVYGIIIAKFVYRSVSWKGLWEIFKKSALQTVVVSIMVVTAQLFGWIVTYYNIPNLLATSIQSIASSATVFLFLVLVMLLIAGMFMEALSVVIIVAPILHPVALAYGIDPIFFGFFTVFVMCIGIATPPFGPCLFVSCSLSQRPFVKVSKEILPFIAVEILVAIILIFLPQIVTFLPNLVK